MQLFNNSRPISRREANDIIGKRKSIAEKIGNWIGAIVRHTGGKNAAANFYEHRGNSFLFTKQSVLRHFYPNGDTSQPPYPNVTHLRVVLGAHEKDDTPFKEGDPTICITGAEQITKIEDSKDGELTFKVTTPDPNPFDEHPPVEGVAGADKFTEDDGTFTIKIL